MVSEARQRIIEGNRSLRIIKNELENLLEKGVLTDDLFMQISALLPSESSISVTALGAQSPNPVVAALTRAAEATTIADDAHHHHGVGSGTMHQGGHRHDAHSNPPAYAPSLPSRNNTGTHQQQHQHQPTPVVQQQVQPAVVPPPAPFISPRPVIAHARALYVYNATDARDCALKKDDVVAVYEYMNADWWLGRNTRTNHEGVFPKTYVELIPGEPDNGYPNEKAGGAYGAQQPGSQGYQSMQGMPQFAQDANGLQQQQSGGNEGGSGKAGEYGKKFGKKLGNAAIFGAGATIGSNIVNSIF